MPYPVESATPLVRVEGENITFKLKLVPKQCLYQSNNRISQIVKLFIKLSSVKLKIEGY